MELSVNTTSNPQSQAATQAKIGRFGMWLFLAALTVLFVACVVGYLIIRLRLSHKVELGSLQLPPILWISTIAIIFSSLTIERAHRLLMLGNVQRFKQQLIWTDMLTACFICTQIPGLWLLFKTHQRVIEGGVAMYGMIIMVILLHAIHVLGGVVPLIAINKRALTTGYTPETALPIRILAMYWHFLGIVWLILFALLTIMG